MLLAFLICAGLCFAFTPAAATAPDGPDLGAILLDSPDVPPRFILDPTNSGAFEDPPAVPSWLSPILEFAAPTRGVDRLWVNAQERRSIAAFVIEYPLPIIASTEVSEVARDTRELAEREFAIPGVSHAHGFIDREGRAIAMFVQGPRAFSVIVVAAGGVTDTDLDLTRRLVLIQAGKAPPGPSELHDVSRTRLAGGSALGAIGAAAVYVGGLSLVGWLRDPLRSRPTKPSPPAGPPDAAAATDVTTRAGRYRRRAEGAVFLELAGLGLAAAGLLPFTWPPGLLLVSLGGCLLWLARVRANRLGRRARAGRWPDQRRLRAAAVAAVATGCVLAGLIAVLLYGIGAVVASAAYGYNVRIVVVGVTLLAIGALARRRALRLAALEAGDMLRRDPRPAVLYLRTFTDDSLTIRTAAHTRRSLLDRLSPIQFERFEEVLVKNLTSIGPVIALNPPGTALAPLGAARETLTADEWQPTVAGWLGEAKAVVVGAAPEVVSDGLAWELAEINKRDLWSKTALVFPPVPDVEMRARWPRFTAALADTAMGQWAIPADPARTLILLGSASNGWMAITARQRTEWTYAAALAEWNAPS